MVNYMMWRILAGLKTWHGELHDVEDLGRVDKKA